MPYKMTKQFTYQCDHGHAQNKSNTHHTKSNVYIQTAAPCFMSLRMRKLAHITNKPVSNNSEEACREDRRNERRPRRRHFDSS